MFKKSSGGNYYQNFQYGRIYLNKGERCLTIKAYQTWKGKHSRLKEWICISFKAKQARVFRYVQELGIQNITYKNFYKQIIRLTDSISHVHRKECLSRYKAIEKKILGLCGEICRIKFKTFQKLTNYILRDCLPLLNSFDDKFIQSIQWPASPYNQRTLLSESLFRSGLKQDSLTKATKVWFGKSPRGLIKRTGKKLKEGNISSLFLAISCRDWNLDNLYTLMDRDYIWYGYFEIKDVRNFISNSYTPKRWIKILDNSNSEINNYFANQNCFEDSLRMFNKIEHSDYQLPKRPQTIQHIHDGLTTEYRRINAWKIKDIQLPVKNTFLDNLEVAEFKFILPRFGEDLICWGDSLKNCLASYVRTVHDGKVEIVGVFKNRQIKYAVSISNKKIYQFLGVKNSVPEAEEENLLREALFSFGIK